jgi:hypothetical protein
MTRFLHGQTDALVGDREHDLAVFDPPRDRDARAGRRVFHSILDELTDSRFDQYLINIHQWQFRVDIDAQLMGGEAMRALSDRGSEDGPRQTGLDAYR